MRAPKVHVVDFETHGVDDRGRPFYPPKPVGVSIRKAGQRRSRYYAWGHPTENNCTEAEARNALRQVWVDSSTPILAHNAKFEYDVATTHFGISEIPWERMHDTMYHLFLHDPHAKTLALKPASEKILGLPPEEQDAVHQWLLDQKIVRKNEKRWGGHISKAPGKLVGRYAEGDTDRALQLFNHLHPLIAQAGMLQAYERERELMPYMLQSEREGMRVDLPKLERDVPMYERAMEKVEAWIRKRLKAPSDLNLDSNEDIADYLERAGVVTEWVYTKTGKRSTSKDNLTLDKYRCKKTAAAMDYRGRLKTVLGTFLKPWLIQARETGGTIHTTWNQVRQSGGIDFSGTRTGRVSSSGPNFMNIPTEFETEVPKHIPGLPPLPFARQYILPDKGQEYVSMDYSQQEFRILAHYESGSLLQAYLDNPRMDVHDWLHDLLVNLIGLDLGRKRVKIVNFGDNYGMGIGLLAQRLQTDVATVRKVKDAKRRLMTGLKDLEDELRSRGKNGLPLRTWGGRIYHCEEPRYSQEYGRWMTFEYKLLNYLIQGSAADCTKEAVLRYLRVRKEGRFLSQVHDEINITAPKRALKTEIKLLREAAESVEFDVPMLVDVKTGPNWHDLVPYRERRAA